MIGEGGGVSHGMADLASFGNADREIEQVGSLTFSLRRLQVLFQSSNLFVKF